MVICNHFKNVLKVISSQDSDAVGAAECSPYKRQILEIECKGPFSSGVAWLNAAAVKS